MKTLDYLVTDMTTLATALATWNAAERLAGIAQHAYSEIMLDRSVTWTDTRAAAAQAMAESAAAWADTAWAEYRTLRDAGGRVA